MYFGEKSAYYEKRRNVIIIEALRDLANNKKARFFVFVIL